MVLNKIKVTPLAAESFGVRSMCTFVETPDVKVLLDAGVSLAPYRFNLLPHPIEFQTIAKLRQRIAKFADKAEVVTLSHYHFDHHTPSYNDWLVNWTQLNETAQQIYKDKIVLAKNPRVNINSSQRQRAWVFQKTGGRYAKNLESADGKSYRFGKETTLRFSEAVPHGLDGSTLGWVIMVTVQYGDERFMFAPDVQGPISARTVDLIKTEKPDVLLIGGPPFYLEGYKIAETRVQEGSTNLTQLAEFVPVVIMEHHALRDAQWKKRVQPIYDEEKSKGHVLLTAADYAGVENTFLESNRRQLYAKFPPSSEFQKWMKLNAKALTQVKPPI
jgi:predicted metallo-beta-lactamase superfamily hydrolase